MVVKEMAKYRKKPVEVEAIQWTGDNTLQVIRFMGQDVDFDRYMERDKFSDYVDYARKEGLKIHTLEGEMTASVGDYIIKGVQGEFYPCKPDIFEATYEKVE